MKMKTEETAGLAGFGCALAIMGMYFLAIVSVLVAAAYGIIVLVNHFTAAT